METMGSSDKLLLTISKDGFSKTYIQRDENVKNVLYIVHFMLTLTSFSLLFYIVHKYICVTLSCVLIYLCPKKIREVQQNIRYKKVTLAEHKNIPGIPASNLQRQRKLLMRKKRRQKTRSFYKYNTEKGVKGIS